MLIHAEIRLWIDSVNAHQTHQTSYTLAIYIPALLLKLCSDASVAEEGTLGIEHIDLSIVHYNLLITLLCLTLGEHYTMGYDQKGQYVSFTKNVHKIIDVALESQGKEFGVKMLRELIDVTDEVKLPIYLETETESNVQFYERFGSKTIEQKDLPVINHPMWTMIREVSIDEKTSIN
jgi:hypothetical protein